MAAAAAAVAGCGFRGGDAPARGGAEGEVVEVEAVVACDLELSSWIVAGRGRHLVLTIDCPDEFDELDGVVEFTSELLRRDYVARRDAAGALVAPRVSRMTPGVRLRPVVRDPDERVEASWSVGIDQARALQRDRTWETPYVLIGANSNSAMVAALRSAGLTPPARVLAGGGVFGEFPGVDQPLGPQIGPEQP